MPDIDYDSLLETNGSLTDQLRNLLSSFQNVSSRPCDSYEFSSRDGAARTLVEEFGLICDHQNLLSVVEMCFLLGAAAGSIISGGLSDRFGRKHTLMVFATIQYICGIYISICFRGFSITIHTLILFPLPCKGVLTGLSTSLTMYMILRVVIGFASMTVVVINFVLVIELVAGKWQTIIGILNILPVTITYVLTASIAYFVRDWRTMQVSVSLPWFMLLTMW